MLQIIEKKNRKMYFDSANEHQCFGIRKLTIGAASVLLGATLFLGGHTQEVHADTLNTSAPMKNDTSTGEEAASQELNNTSQDNVPTNSTVEQAETPSTGTRQLQQASVTHDAQFTNTQSSQASQNKSATLNNYNANQATQSINARPTVNSHVQSIPVQAHGQIPEAHYTPTQASQGQSNALNTYNANKVVSQVKSNTLNSNGTNNTQKATNTSRISARVVQNNANANSATNTSQNNLTANNNTQEATNTSHISARVVQNNTNANSATNTSQNNLATNNNTQDYVTNNPVNNKVKINYDALNKVNKQTNLVLNQPQALHTTNLAMNAQNSVLRLSRNLKDNLNNVNNSKLKLFENNLMALRNTNPYVVSLASTGGDDVNISFPDDGTKDQIVKSQTFEPQPGEHYDTKQDIKTVTRNVEWYIIKANGTIVPTGHTVTDNINFYEPQAKDDQGHLLPEYSWAHWNSSLAQNFNDCTREMEQISSANNNIHFYHIDGGTSDDIIGETLITPDSPNQNIKVYFKEGEISTIVRFIDSDPNNGSVNGDQVVLGGLSIEGPQGAYIDDANQLSEIKNTLQNYLNQGYKVEDGGNPFSGQIDDAAHADPNAVEPNRVQYRTVDGNPDNTAINIMLDHDRKDFGGDQDAPNPKTGQQDKNTQKTVTRTISYVYDNGLPVMENGQPKKVVQPATFSRMAHVDMVTGKVTYDDWGTPKSFSTVTTPTLDGYTPDQSEVKAATVTATDPDSNVTVTYKKNAPVKKDANGQVQYIDDEDNGTVIQTGSFNGKVGDPINYSTQPTIKDLENKGYKLVSDNFGTTPHIFNDGDNNYQVHLVHNHEIFGGDQDTPNPKTGQKDKNTQKTVTRTISYVYDNGSPVMNTNNQPAQAIQKLAFSRQADVDMVTGNVQYAPGSGTFEAVPSPELDGYTPDKATIPAQTVNFTDPDINVTVTYNKNAPVKKDASGQIQYIDDEDNGTVITTGSVNGKVGDPINYSTQPTIKDLENKGYKLVSDNFGTTPHTFKDGNNNYEVHFKHSYETFGGDQDAPNPKTGQKDKNTQKTVTRTISYVYDNGLPVMEKGQPEKVVQPVTFSRMAHVDMVTGKVTYDDWGTPKSFSTVTTPTLDGYTPDQSEVKAATVTATDPNSNVTVTYKKNAPVKKDANGQVQYIDDEDNGIVIKTGSFNGKVGDPINYSTQSTIKDLENKGYELVSDNFGTTSHTFKDDNNNYEVHFKHSYETVKPGNEKTPGTPINPNDPNGPKWPNGTDKNSIEQIGKRTINYTGANSQTPQSIVDTTNFTRQVVVDKVTGQITSATDWQPTSHQFDQVKTPFINHFYADKLYAGKLSVSPSNLEATDLVTYKPMANIIPVDKDHHKIPNVPNPQYTTDPQDPTKAAPNQLVPSIKNMVPDQKTVTPINPGQPTEVIYNEITIPTKRKDARLIFKLNDTNTPNITYLPRIQSLPTMMTDGTSGSPMNDKTIPNVYTVDSSGVVSGGPGYGDTSQWRAIASANGVDLDAPAKAGYTWKIAKITGTDTSQDIYFVYSKAPEQSSLKVVVHDSTTNQDLPQYGYDHKDAPGTTVDYDWPTQKQHLIDNGYKIVNEPTVPSTIPDKPQTVTITVEHDIVPDNNTDHKHTPATPINSKNPNGPKWPSTDNFTNDYTYTVNFNDQNGNKVANPQQQVSTWNRTVYVDKVTGEIKQDQSTPWTPDKPNYDNTNVPVVNGYITNKTSKNGLPVSNMLPGPKTEQNNITDTVIYNTVGKIVPVDPSGKPITGAEQPKYINNQNDPTNVIPNEKVPVIPGKTPRQTSVTPVNPTKDTNVIYDDDDADTSLKVIVNDQTDHRDLKGYGFNSGTVKSGTRVQYTFDQDRRKLIDHGYEIVNVPAIPTVYGKKPQTVTITVKHGVAPVNNQDHKHTPDTPINPNYPNGPKWPAKDNYSQDHTYTVNFSGPNGKQLADSKTQTSHWNRTLNIDKVTGKIVNPHEPWKSDITNYQDTKVPVINGYVANKTSKNGSPVSKILPGTKAVPSDIKDTVQYDKIGRIIPVDPSGKPIQGASTPMYENDPDDPTKVKRTDVPYIKGYTPSVDSVDPKDPTKDTNIVYQKDQPDIVPDNPNENLPSVPNDSNNDLGNFKTPKKKAKKAPAKQAQSSTKQVQGPTKQAHVNNNNAKQPVINNNAGPANKVKAPATNVAQAATLPNKVVTKQAPANNAKKALPQTGEDQNDLMILAVGSLLGAMGLATLAGTRRKRKHE